MTEQKQQPSYLRCRISSDLDAMEALHAQYPWVPGRDNIRPSEATLALKQEAMASCSGTYSVDEWSKQLLGAAWAELQGSGCSQSKYHFEPNAFPYDVPTGTRHYVLWLPSATAVDNSTVNRYCMQAVSALGGCDFVWYVNPKMTVPDIWHVQVFWRAE